MERITLTPPTSPKGTLEAMDYKTWRMLTKMGEEPILLGPNGRKREMTRQGWGPEIMTPEEEEIWKRKLADREAYKDGIDSEEGRRYWGEWIKDVASGIKENERLKALEAQALQPRSRGRSKMETTCKIYFVTMSIATGQFPELSRKMSPEHKIRESLQGRIRSILKGKAYPIEDHFGCIAHNESGELHIHLIVGVRPKRSPTTGKFQYPSPTHWTKCWGRGNVVTEGVRDLANSVRVCNYIEAQEHDTSETLVLFGSRVKFLSWVEANV